MSDMPELKPCPFCGDPMEWGGSEVVRHQSRGNGCILEERGYVNTDKWNTHADAPLHLADAMRCPEVVALVGACSNVIWGEHGKHIEAALAPFIKGLEK